MSRPCMRPKPVDLLTNAPLSSSGLTLCRKRTRDPILSDPGSFLQMESEFFTVLNLWVWAGSGRELWADITSLYSISTWWDASQEFHFDCGSDYWCISDFSEEQDILVTIQDNAIQIVTLSSGELIREVGAPEDYNLVRQALIGLMGQLPLWGLTWVKGFTGTHLKMWRYTSVEPPYQDEPVLVLSDAGLLNLLGWASPSLLLADGNNLEGAFPGKWYNPRRSHVWLTLKPEKGCGCRWGLISLWSSVP